MTGKGNVWLTQAVGHTVKEKDKRRDFGDGHTTKGLRDFADFACYVCVRHWEPLRGL